MATQVTTRASPTPTVRVPPGFARVAGGLVVVAALYLRWRSAGAWNFVDLEDFFYGGSSVMDGSDVYAARPGVLPFNYPPFAAVAFVPLALVGLPVAKVLFTAATLGAYAASLTAVRRSAEISWGAIVFVGLLGLSLEPVVRALVLGQIGVILMALVLTDLFLVPPRFRGVLIGVAAGVKLTPALFVLCLVVRRDWASVGRAAGAALATIGIGWLAAPQSSQRYWLGGFDKLDRFGDLAFTSVNQSLTSFVARLVGSPSSPLLWAACVAAAALTVAVVTNLVRRGDWLGVTLAVAGATLMISPISWTHHWVWAVPLIAHLVGAGRVFIAAAVAIVTFAAPMWWVPETDALSVGQLILSYAYLLGCIALMLCALVSRWRLASLQGLEHDSHRAAP